ncbi:hypothetical protein ACVILJ_001746 [Bradyrhizobium diazoefficiens]|nr:hypothetical protein BD122_18040 [Bradyrhizobium diazoefficiens]
MPYETKPLPFDPKSISGISERVLVSHYENNYGGAVKRAQRDQHATRRVGLRQGAELRHQRPETRRIDRGELDDPA